jgi:putative oxidoreductase
MTGTSDHASWSLHAIIAATVDRLVWVCALIPYALIALLVRIVMGRVFFLAGQDKLKGPSVPIHLGLPGSELSLLDMSITLPADIKDSTLQLFEANYAHTPVSPAVLAYVVTYAEFVAPVCLVIGFAARFAALALLVLTMLLQFYVAPALWWSHHVYWVCLLLLLIALGPSTLSVDALLRWLYDREKPP